MTHSGTKSGLLVANKSAARLDSFLAEEGSMSRSFVKRLILNGHVLVNGQIEKPHCVLKAGDEVRFRVPKPESLEAQPENIPLSIVFEDGDILVVDKPQGMVVHPAPGHFDGTLVNAVLHHAKDLSGIGGALRPGIVHRIDKMTSGLLVVAKNDFAHQILSERLKARQIKRTYLAIAEGNLKEDSGTINAPIQRHPTDRKRMAVREGGREAVTHFEALERFGAFTLLKLRLETGRTHQIRVHMAHIKHPVAGDVLYGPKAPKLGLLGQALHAAKLELEHPRSGEKMVFFAPLPGYFLKALAKLGWNGNENGLNAKI